jgi:hypothetical protein
MIISELKNMDRDHYLWEYSDFTAGTTVALMGRLNARQRKQNPKSSINLLEILNDSRDFKCTVLNDKIYGVLGLADDKDSYPVPDYALLPKDVFKATATSLINTKDDLNILYYCSQSGTTKLAETPPTWAPDWTRRCLHTPLYLTSLQCKASGNSTSSHHFANDVLKVRGRIVETIRHIDHCRKIPRNSTKQGGQRTTVLDHEGQERTMNMTSDLTSQDPRQSLRQSIQDQWKYIDNILNMAFPDGEYSNERFEALWRTFVCDQTASGEVAPIHWEARFSTHVAGFMHVGGGSEKWLEKLQNIQSTTSDTSNHAVTGISGLRDTVINFKPPKLDEDTHDFTFAHGERCHDRRFFISEAGRFGWGPDGMKEGDIVAILNGLDFPLVLRRVEQGFEVVGDCYAHGIMLGESMENAQDEMLNIV